MEGYIQKYVPSEEDYNKLENNFRYHSPINDQPERYEYLRAEAKKLAHAILALTPKSREQSLALTSLEDAIMWANASIARNEKLGEE